MEDANLNGTRDETEVEDDGGVQRRTISLTREEADAFAEAARNLGLSVGVWLKQVARAAAGLSSLASKR